MKFEIKDRWTNTTVFECELPAEVAAKSYGERLGYAVQQAYNSGVSLIKANLSNANLIGADLYRVNLIDANLTNANLDGANLTDANLDGANLTNANSVDLAIAKTRILPDGDLIGWKKCRGGVIVKLRIPADAKRCNAFGRKCRAEFADVLEVIGAEVGISQHDGKTEYRVGERVVPDRFDDDWRKECAPGIHFFITRAEAEAY
jgi:hypothetical protein